MKKFIVCLIMAGCLVPQSFYAQEIPGKQSKSISKKGEVNLREVPEPMNKVTELREMPAQGISTEEPIKRSFVFSKKAEVNLSAITVDFAPSLLIREMPGQGGKKMVEYPAPAPFNGKQASKARVDLLPPVLGESFLGNPFGVSTPNDNDLAISDSGMVLSVINTNILVKNLKTNTLEPVKTLAAFTDPVNKFHREFDPKVMYDPNMDRFVLVCMVGNVDTTSKVIVGFSQTGDPSQGWNLYELPGDALENGLWSDYPMIAMTEKELFLTINLLYNDSSWQTGFVETIVWQITKDNGYSGKNLNSVLHSNIKWKGKPIRNLCPVKGGSRFYGPDMYFISNRNLASQNDTVFIVNISDVIGAPTSSVSVKAVRTNLPYRFPPDGIQKETTQTLATNDSRNLGAFFENGLIQYVHNTENPSNSRPTVYYGVIYYPETPQPVITGFMIDNGTNDYAYPNISYAGLDSTDNSAIISFNHSSNDVFAGCSAVRADTWGSFSPVLKIKDGLNYVNLLQGDQERWGDYSGSQRRYSKPGEVWMSGYFSSYHNSNFPKAHAAWVAQLTTQEGLELGIKAPNNSSQELNVYPNPAVELFSVEVKLDRAEYLNFGLYDVRGALIRTLLRDWVKGTDNVFSFNTGGLEEGIYFLKITGNNGTDISRKIVVR